MARKSQRTGRKSGDVPQKAHDDAGASESRNADANDDSREAREASGRSPGQDAAAFAKMMTPERAMELYKTNAELALDVINAALEGTSKLRRKQFEGEEAARDFQRRQVRTAAQARDPQALVAAQQGATQEAVERSLRYWNEMFELIVEIQKRLFTLMQEQFAGMPGMRETRNAMAMYPDLGEMQKVIAAMQGVLASGASTFESMQRAVLGPYASRARGDESDR
ncbi:MAG TPA: TIGR01841 family phasin [Casimicrobiaceae bacterium]|nr:TIGR01841 family phasin [Casimicrobiaceae bacterium]